MTAHVRLHAPDWCHFSQRLQRSRAHKQVKGAELPFEDERFSYVALTRAPVAQHRARVLAQPAVNKVAVTAKLCTPDGVALAMYRAGPADYAERPALALGRCGDALQSRGKMGPGSAVHRQETLHRVRDMGSGMNYTGLTSDQIQAQIPRAGCRTAAFSSSFAPFRSIRSSPPCRPAGSFSASLSFSLFCDSASITAWSRCGSASDQAFADIDVQLKQRHDLIPNLIETVKGYAAHEKGTLDAVIKARNAAISAQGPRAGRCRKPV